MLCGECLGRCPLILNAICIIAINQYFQPFTLFLMEVLKTVVHWSGICRSHLSRQLSCACSLLTLAKKFIRMVAYCNLSNPLVFCCGCLCPNCPKIHSRESECSSLKTLWFRTRLLFMSYNIHELKGEK